MSAILKDWIYKASVPEQMELASRCGTSRSYLYHIGVHRFPSPELAAKIEAASKDMNIESGGRLPVIYRTDLTPACRNCEFARKALGTIAVRSDFDEALMAKYSKRKA